MVYLIALEINDDITMQQLLLHEIPQKCNLGEKWQQVLKDYGITQKVIEAVKIVSNKNQTLENYYQAIEKNSGSFIRKVI